MVVNESKYESENAPLFECNLTCRGRWRLAAGRLGRRRFVVLVVKPRIAVVLVLFLPPLQKRRQLRVHGTLERRRKEAAVAVTAVRDTRRASAANTPCRWVFFGLWRVCFPPCLVRPGRRLPVQ